MGFSTSNLSKLTDIVSSNSVVPNNIKDGLAKATDITGQMKQVAECFNELEYDQYEAYNKFGFPEGEFFISIDQLVELIWELIKMCGVLSGKSASGVVSEEEINTFRGLFLAILSGLENTEHYDTAKKLYDMLEMFTFELDKRIRCIADAKLLTDFADSYIKFDYASNPILSKAKGIISDGGLSVSPSTMLSRLTGNQMALSGYFNTVRVYMSKVAAKLAVSSFSMSNKTQTGLFLAKQLYDSYFPKILERLENSNNTVIKGFTEGARKAFEI